MEASGSTVFLGAEASGSKKPQFSVGSTAEGGGRRAEAGGSKKEAKKARTRARHMRARARSTYRARYRNEDREMRKPIPKKLRFDVLHRDGFRCRYCGAAPPQVVLHLDHVVAHSKGGLDTFENLLTACAPCNIGKGVTDLQHAASAGGGVRAKSGLAPARIEFFWDMERKDGVDFVNRARCVDWPPEGVRGWEFDDTEYGALCRSRSPYFSTFGWSGREFSRHLLVSKIHDLLGSMWLRGSDYTGFLDDLLFLSETGRIPDYAAPVILRATHPEVYHSRCVARERYYEDQLDALAGQFIAVFADFLGREHTASQAANPRWQS